MKREHTGDDEKITAVAGERVKSLRPSSLSLIPGIDITAPSGVVHLLF